MYKKQQKIMSKYLDLAGLTAYDAKLKEWIKSGLVDITDDEIRALFATSAYKMVDLGLPSGLKWADRNVGATTPQDNGLYFSWGNVDGHAVDENGKVADGYPFDKNTYPTTLGGQYTGSTLDEEHDAAAANMGGDWRMPTNTEILEMVQNTDHYYISEDGSIVAGPFTYETPGSDKKVEYYKLRSICFVKKGEVFDYNNHSNFIEFPIAGRCENYLLIEEGEYGSVWASSAFYEYARYLYFNAWGKLDGNYYGSSYNGHPVRGVHV